jgi:cell cycle checkpoint protein
VEDLALNKTKVKEVRTCLGNILYGSAKQRLVVLKGPAGTGKTATVEAVAKDMNIEILEWRNPQTAARGEDYGEEGAFSAGLSGMFEEFIGRAGKFGSLELVSSVTSELQAPSTAPTTTAEDTKRKFIVIEDFPNTLFTSSSAPLQSFRHTIKSFLALPPPPLGATPLPPLILIITETASVSGPNAFTAHRLLSPEILHHHLTREINFNKIAPTFMFKALTRIVSREAQHSNRKLGPSKPVLDAISSSGDIRSAVMTLEFLSSSGQGFTEPIITKVKRGKKPADRQLTEAEARMVAAVTQRESNFGIFHAVGKVVFNKRYGDDVDDVYMPPPPRPPIPGMPYHNRAVRVDVNMLIDETGTDPLTFLGAIHENYLPSCNPGGRVLPLSTADEEILDTINACLDSLSDADILLPRGYSTESSAVRAEEIAFQVGVRGVMLSLPSPVKRLGGPQQARVYYPTGERLWREQQEVGDSVEWLIDKERAKGTKVGGKKEAIEERVPFTAVVERRKNWRRGRTGAGSFGGRNVGDWGLRQETMDEPTRKALEKATTFKGVGKQSEEVDDDEDEEEHARSKWKQKNNAHGDELSEGWFVAGTEKLVLSDDDIEEF